MIIMALLNEERMYGSSFVYFKLDKYVACYFDCSNRVPMVPFMLFRRGFRLVSAPLNMHRSFTKVEQPAGHYYPNPVTKLTKNSHQLPVPDSTLVEEGSVRLERASCLLVSIWRLADRNRQI